MQLAGRLRSTTLGDLLGGLHREVATGTLELVEDHGRTHRVHLIRGLVTAVELDAATPSLAEMLRQARAADDDLLRRSLLRALASSRLHGQVLIDEFHVAPAVVGAALRRQVLSRLAAIDRLPDARVCFRVTVRPPRYALHGGADGPRHVPSWNAALTAREFLSGRRRARPRAPRPAARTAEEEAWSVLGLSPGLSSDEVKRAYRRLARTVHPDLHPDASAAERRALEVRFIEITAAYGLIARAHEARIND